MTIITEIIIIKGFMAVVTKVTVIKGPIVIIIIYIK